MILKTLKKSFLLKLERKDIRYSIIPPRRSTQKIKRGFWRELEPLGSLFFVPFAGITQIRLLWVCSQINLKITPKRDLIM